MILSFNHIIRLHRSISLRSKCKLIILLVPVKRSLHGGWTRPGQYNGIEGPYSKLRPGTQNGRIRTAGGEGDGDGDGDGDLSSARLSMLSIE